MTEMSGELILQTGKRLLAILPRPLVRLRRYLARNHPFLWQIRLHALLGVSAALLALCVVLGSLLPIGPASVPDVEVWHVSLFLISFLCVLYWLVSYLLLLDPSQMPPTIREPPLAALVLCTVLILLPSYAFLSVAKFRMANVFSDIDREEDARDLLQILADDAGDPRGVFASSTIRNLKPPNSDPSAPAAQHGAYFTGPDGIVGPPDKAGVRLPQFRRELICKIGESLLHDVVMSTEFSLQRPSESGRRTGKLVPRGPVKDASSLFQPLREFYPVLATATSYAVTGPDVGQGPYHLKLVTGREGGDTKSAGAEINVRLVCADLSDQQASELFDGLSRALPALLRDYVNVTSPDQIPQLSSMIFTPVCEVGKRVDDCYTAYDRLKDTIARSELDRSKEKLKIIKSVVGSYQEIDGYDATLSSPPTSEQASDLTVQVKRGPVKDNSLGAVSWGWLLIWIFILALLASTVKSFRLVREASANYIFAALFFLLGVLALATFGIPYINEKLTALIRYFGGKGFEVSFNGDNVLLTYFVVSLVYVLWQVTRTRCSRWARAIASFNLFFVLVMSFYWPFMTFPIIGSISSGGWAIPVIYVVYFGLLFDICYALARRARERPA